MHTHSDRDTHTDIDIHTDIGTHTATNTQTGTQLFKAVRTKMLGQGPKMAQGLLSLARTGLKDSEACLQQVTRHAGTQAPRFTSTDGKYSPGLFSRAKPVDRSTHWIPKNPFIEAWYYRRDNFEKEFVWNFRNAVEGLWFFGGFTAGFYYLALWCTDHSTRRSGYPKRTFLSGEPGFVLPDEREFY
jgi:hypothetical protein